MRRVPTTHPGTFSTPKRSKACRYHAGRLPGVDGSMAECEPGMPLGTLFTIKTPREPPLGTPISCTPLHEKPAPKAPPGPDLATPASLSGPQMWDKVGYKPPLLLPFLLLFCSFLLVLGLFQGGSGVSPLLESRKSTLGQIPPGFKGVLIKCAESASFAPFSAPFCSPFSPFFDGKVLLKALRAWVLKGAETSLFFTFRSSLPGIRKFARTPWFKGLSARFSSPFLLVFDRFLSKRGQN